MTDPIESPEAFARRVLVSANALEDIDDEEDILDVVGVTTGQVRARDAAVRREAFREAAEWCAVAGNGGWTLRDAEKHFRALATGGSGG